VGFPSRDSKGEADWKMKGQKVATVGRGSKREKKNGGVVDAGISASPNPAPPPQPFYRPFSGLTLVSCCQKRTSGLYGAKED